MREKAFCCGDGGVLEMILLVSTYTRKRVISDLRNRALEISC